VGRLGRLPVLRAGCKKAALPRVHAENRTAQRYTREMDLKLVSRTLLLAVAGASFAIPALAQWQWIDKDGRKVYSDRSPPSISRKKTS
jgi:hypothetical protein